MAHQEPRSLQDLQKMRVDDLIQWLSRNKADNLPARAKAKVKLDHPRIRIKSSEYKNTGKKNTKPKPRKAPPPVEEPSSSKNPVMRVVRIHRPHIRKSVEDRISSYQQRNAARFKAFAAKVARLKSLCTAYDAISEEIKYDECKQALAPALKEEKPPTKASSCIEDDNEEQEERNKRRGVRRFFYRL